MNIDISILLPSIRPVNLKRWYNACKNACKNHSFEVIIISPFDLPEELNNIGNIKLVRSFANPTVALQVGGLFCVGKFMLISADDLIYLPDSIDETLDLWDKEKLGKFDIINARYREAALDVNTLLPIDNPPPELPLEYWTVKYHNAFKLPYIDKNWNISLQPLLLRDTFYEIGGLETNGYENSVFPILELCFRLQKLGGKIVNSVNEVSWASHTPHTTYDHAPIHFGMCKDENCFKSRFFNNIIDSILYLKYDSWKEQSNFWNRRFNVIENTIKKDLSITFPSIRNKNLLKVYDAIKESCKNHTFEVVICSPNNPPPELPKENVKWIKSYTCPSVCWQMCYMIANSEFVIDGSDDALFQPNVLDDAIELYKSNNLQIRDVVSMELSEGTLDPETLEKLPNAESHTLNPYFFYVHANLPFRKRCINQGWKISLNFLVKLDTFLEIGGFDCQYEYANHSLHDFILRMQSLGGKVISFPRRSLLVSHYPDETGDHAPVHNAQKKHDEQVFDKLYSSLDTLESIQKIDFNNWKESEHCLVWNRRFKDIKI